MNESTKYEMYRMGQELYGISDETVWAMVNSEGEFASYADRPDVCMGIDLDNNQQTVRSEDLTFDALKRAMAARPRKF